MHLPPIIDLLHYIIKMFVYDKFSGIYFAARFYISFQLVQKFAFTCSILYVHYNKVQLISLNNVNFNLKKYAI